MVLRGLGLRETMVLFNSRVSLAPFWPSPSVRPFLVLGTEERVALFTLGLVLVEELVEAEEVLAGGAVHVVPPVADEVLLVEDGAVGAQESVEVPVGLAHVEHLRREEKTV